MYLVFGLLQPLMFFYGMAMALKGGDQSVSYLVPGFMVYTATGACFLASVYGFYEYLSTQRVQAWMAATVPMAGILMAQIYWNTLRGSLMALCLLGTSFLMFRNLEFHHVGLTMALIVGMNVVLAFWGCAVGILCRSIDEVYLTDNLLYGIFVFGGIFVGIQEFPKAIQYFSALIPSWHGIEIIRPLAMGGSVETGKALAHVAMLVFEGVLGFGLSLHWLERKLMDA